MTTPSEPNDPWAQRPSNPPPSAQRDQPGENIPPPPHSSLTPPGAPPPGFEQYPTNSQFGQPPQPPYGQQPYGQNQYGQYGQNQFGVPANPKAKNWMGIVALISGIVMCFCVPSILAVVFGHLGRDAAKKGNATNGGMALAGLILGYVGIALFIGFVALSLWADMECPGNNTSEFCKGWNESQ